MNCNLDTALLQDLIEGTIDPVEKIFVEEHIKTCKACRKELAELKLLLWDLNDKSNYEVNMPPELDWVKASLLNEFTDGTGKKPTEIVMDIHRRNVRSAGMFLDYVPGVKTGNELIKQGVRSAPSALGKALVKTTRYLLAE